MFWKKHEPESETAVTLYHFEVAETSDELTGGATETTNGTNWHCAWCGDPPDENGSSDICPTHRAQMEAQSAARAALRRSRGQA